MVRLEGRGKKGGEETELQMKIFNASKRVQCAFFFGRVANLRRCHVSEMRCAVALLLIRSTVTGPTQFHTGEVLNHFRCGGWGGGLTDRECLPGGGIRAQNLLLTLNLDKSHSMK